MSVDIQGINESTQFVGDVVEGAIGATVVRTEGLLRELTPVDTGFAQNSWLVTLNRNDQGTPGGNPPANSSFVNEYSLSEVAYINNGASYIGVLEDGRSNQAPNGMVSVVLPEVPMILSEEVAKRRR